MPNNQSRSRQFSKYTSKSEVKLTRPFSELSTLDRKESEILKKLSKINNQLLKETKNPIPSKTKNIEVLMTNFKKNNFLGPKLSTLNNSIRTLKMLNKRENQSLSSLDVFLSVEEKVTMKKKKPFNLVKAKKSQEYLPY